jgi:iron complex transport system substrate-binding protein
MPHADDRVVLRSDSTSRYSEAARRLPNVGYMRALSAEGIGALAPEELAGVFGVEVETLVSGAGLPVFATRPPGEFPMRPRP